MNRIKFWNVTPPHPHGWMHDTSVPCCAGPIICDVSTLPRFQQFIWCTKTFKLTTFLWLFPFKFLGRKTSALLVSSTQIEIWWECVRVVCVCVCHITYDLPAPSVRVLSSFSRTALWHQTGNMASPRSPALHPAQTDSQTPTVRRRQSPAVGGAHLRGISPHMYSGDRILISHRLPCNSAEGGKKMVDLLLPCLIRN